MGLGSAFESAWFDVIGTVGDAVGGDHPQQRLVEPADVARVGDHSSQERIERLHGSFESGFPIWVEPETVPALNRSPAQHRVPPHV